MSEGDEPFTIECAKEAEREIGELPAADARMILQKIQSLLTAKPFKVSKTRVKRLVGFAPSRCIGCEWETTGLTTVLVRSKL